MGGGEFIPNGSIYWTICEDDVTEQGGNVQRNRIRPDLHGRDPIRNNHIGKGKGAGSHPDELRVTLRFKTNGDATKALSDALAGMKPNAASGLIEVEIRIPPQFASEADAKRPYPNDHAQARVEW